MLYGFKIQFSIMMFLWFSGFSWPQLWGSTSAASARKPVAGGAANRAEPSRVHHRQRLSSQLQKSPWDGKNQSIFIGIFLCVCVSQYVTPKKIVYSLNHGCPVPH